MLGLAVVASSVAKVATMAQGSIAVKRVDPIRVTVSTIPLSQFQQTPLQASHRCQPPLAAGHTPPEP